MQKKFAKFFSPQTKHGRGPNSISVNWPRLSTDPSAKAQASKPLRWQGSNSFSLAGKSGTTSGGAAASRSWPPVDTTMWIKETATRGGRRRQLLLDMHSHCVEQATCEAWASGAAAASAARRLREHSKPAAGRRHLF